VKRITLARAQAERKLAKLGYQAVFRGITSRGGALAELGGTRVVASSCLSVDGALVWFGAEKEGKLALYYLQPLSCC